MNSLLTAEHLAYHGPGQRVNDATADALRELGQRSPRRVVIARARADSHKAIWFGLGGVIAAHLLVVLLLLQYEPARTALTAMAPIMVDLIVPPKLQEPAPPPPPAQSKPRIEPRKTIEPPPIIAAPPVDAPAAFVTPPAPPAPPVEVVEAPVSVVPPAPPAPVTPPSFDAAYLQNAAPRYPAASRRMSEQGRVMLRVLVNTGGEPDKVELRQTSGFDRLDTAALETVRTWKFVPARQAGQAIAAWVQVPIVFTLER